MNQFFVYMTHIPTHLYHKVETNPPNIDENDGEACDVKKKPKNKQELSTFGQYKVYYEVLRDLEQGGAQSYSKWYLYSSHIYILLLFITSVRIYAVFISNKNKNSKRKRQV